MLSPKQQKMRCRANMNPKLAYQRRGAQRAVARGAQAPIEFSLNDRILA
jgi:hypothetical protein